MYSIRLHMEGLQQCTTKQSTEIRKQHAENQRALLRYTVISFWFHHYSDMMTSYRVIMISWVTKCPAWRNGGLFSFLMYCRLYIVLLDPKLRYSEIPVSHGLWSHVSVLFHPVLNSTKRKPGREENQTGSPSRIVLGALVFRRLCRAAPAGSFVAFLKLSHDPPSVRKSKFKVFVLLTFCATTLMCRRVICTPAALFAKVIFAYGFTFPRLSRLFCSPVFAFWAVFVSHVRAWVVPSWIEPRKKKTTTQACQVKQMSVFQYCTSLLVDRSTSMWAGSQEAAQNMHEDCGFCQCLVVEVVSKSSYSAL